MKYRLKFLGWWLFLIGLGILSFIYYIIFGWIVWILSMEGRGTFWDNWLYTLSNKIINKIEQYRYLINK